MKKLYYLILSLIICSLSPIMVNASGSLKVSKTTINLTKGGAATFDITAENAAGRVDVSSLNSAIATVSESSVFLDMQSTKITVKGVNVGSTTITVLAKDMTTYDDEVISGKKYIINVVVSNPVILSNNNELKELTVDGYNLTKIDNNNYSLDVTNEVSAIKVNGVASDSKATISGIGEHSLKIGENVIEIIVTSESKKKNIIVLKVNRKEGYSLNELENAIKNGIFDININEENISAANLNIIKNSKKIINFNKDDENKNLIYSWIVDGNKINDIKEISTLVTFNSSNNDILDKNINYVEKLILNFSHSGKLPEGTIFKLNVSNKYNNNDNLKLYYYNESNNKLELIKDNIIVNNGEVEFELNHCSIYLLTKATLNNDVKVNTTKVNKSNIYLIIEFVIIVALLIVLFIKRKKEKI